jgi:hypothetical protein
MTNRTWNYYEDLLYMRPTLYFYHGIPPDDANPCHAHFAKLEPIPVDPLHLKAVMSTGALSPWRGQRKRMVTVFLLVESQYLRVR